ncbi:zinc-binding alcohol dehydrogenase family protein [Candidatus Neomarinimicrobiota bacterium]
MKAYLLRKRGNPNVLQMEDVPIPIPGNGEVRIKVRYIGLNYAEIQSRKGLYNWAPKLPYIPGMEAFGVIDEIGVGVNKNRIGENVIVGSKYGAYAEYLIAKDDLTLSSISEYTDEQNVAFPVNYLTAWIALMKLARLSSNDTVLIQAAAGGVGTAAVQIAKNYGCKVYGTVGQTKKIETLKNLNIDHIINYSDSDFEKEIMDITKGEGVDVIIEVVGGDVFKKSLRLLKPFGRIIVIGFASLNLKKWNPISWLNTIKDIPQAKIKSLAVSSTGVLASHIGYLLKNPSVMQEIWKELVEYVETNNIKPVVGHHYSFSDLAHAHELMESRKSIGKIVIRMD